MAKNKMRAGYKHSDFAKLVRGRFHAEAAMSVLAAQLEPEFAKTVPTSPTLNDALTALLTPTEQTSSRQREPY